MAVTQLSQKDYLKKYLSSGSDEKKKKKKKVVKSTQERFRVVDDDIDLKNMRPLDESELDIYNLAEDAPQIAGIIDDRPEELKALEEYSGKKWKIMSDENGIEDIKVTAIENTRNVKNFEVPNTTLRKPPESSDKEGKNPQNKHRDSDSSPVRKNLHDSDTFPPRKSRADSDSDNSPRRKMNKTNDDKSPPRKRKKSYDSDTSPPRRNLNVLGKSSLKTKQDLSPNRRSRDTDRSSSKTNKYRDVSPPRKSKEIYRKSNQDSPRSLKHSSDPSQLRKSRFHSDSDSSPPRKSEVADRLFQKSSKVHNHKSDSDESPHRRSSSYYKSSRKGDLSHSGSNNKFDHNESRFSAQRKEKYLNRRSLSPLYNQNRSRSPQMKTKRRNSPELSSKKNRSYSNDSDSDNSPRRLLRKASLPDEREKCSSLDRKDKNVKMKDKLEKTLDGKRAGLQDANELRKELSSFKQREDDLFAKMGDEVSGRGATAILRDRQTGKRRNLEEEAKQKQEEDAIVAVHKEKYSRWGKGLKQVEDQEKNLQHALHEMSKPLARYADDDDLERDLRNQEREGDPMLEYIRSKKVEDTSKSKLKYQGSFLPNRFGIRPGHRWDGVDRSNGYEKKWFEQQNARRAVDEEAYKWSTSDM